MTATNTREIDLTFRVDAAAFPQLLELSESVGANLHTMLVVPLQGVPVAQQPAPWPWSVQDALLAAAERQRQMDEAQLAELNRAEAIIESELEAEPAPQASRYAGGRRHKPLCGWKQALTLLATWPRSEFKAYTDLEPHFLPWFKPDTARVKLDEVTREGWAEKRGKGRNANYRITKAGEVALRTSWDNPFITNPDELKQTIAMANA